MSRFRRRRIAFYTTLSLVALLCSGGRMTAAADSGQVAAAAASDDLSSFLWPQADARLTDREGRTLKRRDLDDKVVVVAFFDTDCSAPCVIRTLDLAAVAQGLSVEDRAHVALLSVKLDPAQDDAAALSAFADAMRLDTSSVTLLAASAGTTARMMDRIGFRPLPRAPDPVPATIFVFDRRGNSAMRYAGDPVDRRRLAADLATLAGLERGVGQSVTASPSL